MSKYVPEKGDFVILTFDPRVGREQKGPRPALVVSSTLFNRHTGLAMVCPMTNTCRHVPFHVEAPADSSLTGYIMVEQIKSIDYRLRHVQFVEKAPASVLDEALGTLLAVVVDISVRWRARLDRPTVVSHESLELERELLPWLGSACSRLVGPRHQIGRLVMVTGVHHVVHDFLTTLPVVNRPAMGVLVPEFLDKALPKSLHYFRATHASQVLPPVLTPPAGHSGLRFLQRGDRTRKPAGRHEVEDLDFPLLLAARDPPNGLPVAFERSLVQKTERGRFLTNLRCVQNGGDLQVEIAMEDAHGPPGSLRLSIPEPLESRHLPGFIVAERKLPHPSRLALEDQLRGPAIGLVRLLWSGKAVDIDAVSRNQNEIVQVAADQLRLVLGPQRSVYGGEYILLRRRRREVEQGELFLICHRETLAATETWRFAPAANSRPWASRPTYGRPALGRRVSFVLRPTA